LVIESSSFGILVKPFRKILLMRVECSECNLTTG
jgi:hypothetical protein